MNARRRAVYERRKAAGKCVRCDRRAKPGRTRCAACVEYTRFWSQSKRDQRVARGVCARCGANPAAKFRECAACRRAHAQQQQEVSL